MARDLPSGVTENLNESSHDNKVAFSRQQHIYVFAMLFEDLCLKRRWERAVYGKLSPVAEDTLWIRWQGRDPTYVKVNMAG